MCTRSIIAGSSCKRFQCLDITILKIKLKKLFKGNIMMKDYSAISAKNIENKPKNIGLYSKIVAHSHYNHFLAQLLINPKSGEWIVSDVKKQVEQCFL